MSICCACAQGTAGKSTTIAFFVILVTSMWHGIGLPTQQYCGNKEKDVHKKCTEILWFGPGRKVEEYSTVRNREELKFL